MGRDAGGACILIALQSLNTAQRKHKSTGRGDEIRPDTQRPGNIRGRYQLSRSNDFDALSQTMRIEFVH